MNILEKLRYVPEGTIMYSPLFKDPVTFLRINEGAPYPIICKTIIGEIFVFTQEGYYTKETAPQNCMLFPTSEMTWENYHYIKDKQLVAVSINGKYTYIGCVKGGFYTTSTICYWRINLTTGFVENNTCMPCNEIISDEDIPLINELINDRGYIIGDNSLIKIFKKGDIIVNNVGIIALFDSLKNSSKPDTIVFQAIRRINGEIIVKTDTGIGYVSDARLATKEEKDLFFDSLTKAGYSWNGEKVVPVFKKGDIVSSGDCVAIVDHVGDFCNTGDTVYYQAVINNFGNLKIKVDVGIGGPKCCKFASTEQKEKILAKLVASGYNLVDDTVKPLEHKLTPFEKVLVRDNNEQCWKCDFFSHIDDEMPHFKFKCTGGAWKYCIHYNNETAHLVGTNNPAPKRYQTQG